MTLTTPLLGIEPVRNGSSALHHLPSRLRDLRRAVSARIVDGRDLRRLLARAQRTRRPRMTRYECTRCHTEVATPTTSPTGVQVHGGHVAERLDRTCGTWAYRVSTRPEGPLTAPEEWTSACHRRPRMKLYIRHAALFHAGCLSDDEQTDALEIMDGTQNATLDLTARCQKCGALLKKGPAC